MMPLDEAKAEMVTNCIHKKKSTSTLKKHNCCRCRAVIMENLLDFGKFVGFNKAKAQIMDVIKES